VPCLAEATILPVALEDEDTGQAVYTVALFPGDVQKGMAAAKRLQNQLQQRTALTAGFDQRTFGRVHLESVSAPFLVGIESWQWGWQPSWAAGRLLVRKAGRQADANAGLGWQRTIELHAMLCGSQTPAHPSRRVVLEHNTFLDSFSAAAAGRWHR